MVGGCHSRDTCIPVWIQPSLTGFFVQLLFIWHWPPVWVSLDKDLTYDLRQHVPRGSKTVPSLQVVHDLTNVEVGPPTRREMSHLT